MPCAHSKRLRGPLSSAEMFAWTFALRSALFPPMKICSKCDQPAAPRRAYCLACHAANMRVFRSLHPMTPEQRKRANARSYLHVYVKRGKVVRQPCAVCGDAHAEAHHPNYDKPLNVRWLCRLHHLELHGAVAY